MNYSWNEGWTLFTKKKYAEALPHMEHTAKLAPENPEVLYDLALVQLAVGEKDLAINSLIKAISINPNLKKQAAGDNDLESMHNDPRFQELIK